MTLYYTNCSVFTAASLLLLVTSCSDENTVHPCPMPLPDQSVSRLCTLTVADSIGIAIGDSNFVFGSVREVDLGSGGEVYVLDNIRCSIFRYSSTGEYIGQIGRKGSGPGEFLQPGFMVVTDNGSLCISDSEVGWVYLDSNGEVLSSSPYSQIRPMQMTAVPGGAILGIRSTLSSGDNCLNVEKSVCIWKEESPDSVTEEYLTQQYSFDTTDMNRFRSDLIRVDMFPMLFAAGRDFVCIAPSPREESLLLIFNADGTLRDSLELHYPSVQRSDEEILEQKAFMEELFYTSSRYTHSVDWEPFSDHPMIVSLGVDTLDRIIVQRGFEPHPVFDIFDASGEHIQTAFLPEVTASMHWKFHLCRNGILAVPEAPENYYSVYLVTEND